MGVCVLVCVCVCVCVCVFCFVIQTGQSNPGQAYGACKFNLSQHLRQIATHYVSSHICRSLTGDALHCSHACSVCTASRWYVHALAVLLCGIDGWVLYHVLLQIADADMAGFSPLSPNNR